MFGEKKEKPEKYVPNKTRKGKCQWCGTRGRCNCQNQYNDAAAQVFACAKLCGRHKDKSQICGGPLRGKKGVCPCEFC